MNMVKDEDAAKYGEDELIAKAIEILYSRLKSTPVDLMSSPTVVKNYLRLKLATIQHEVFCVMYLDVKNRVIHYEELFRGTLTHTSVYPREVLKEALAHNCSSVILAHNHPSGSPEPSNADHVLTKRLKDALDLIDVRVLDHIIIAGRDTYSFAENGEI